MSIFNWSCRKVGGIFFWKLGRLGGSFYVSRAACDNARREYQGGHTMVVRQER